MKKVAAILFLCLLLFNLYGYQALLDYLQTKEGVQFRVQTGSGIPDYELVSIKVAIHLPDYVRPSDNEEWINNEEEMDRTVHQCMKSRIMGDYIEYLCLPAASKVESVRVEFFKLCQDLQAASQQTKKPVAIVIKPVSFECVPFSLADVTGLLIPNTPQYLRYYQKGHLSNYSDTPERPPDARTFA